MRLRQAAWRQTIQPLSGANPPGVARSLSESPPADGVSEGEVAGAAVFLSSAASDYARGHVLVLDGGWMAP